MHGRNAKKLIFLFAALCMLVAFACISVSKFVISDKKELVGVYTDFVLSHDGDGQTAVIRTDATGTAVGYITTTVSNFADDKISKRDVLFSLREPTNAEITNGYVVDAWGARHSVTSASQNYDITIVDEYDNTLDQTSDVTLLKANAQNSSLLLLKITRKNAATMPTDEEEQVSVVLETSTPYRDLQVFTVNTTTARLSVGVTFDDYNGYDRGIVNLKTAIDFVRGTTIASNASYMAEVTFTLDGDVAFDYARYAEMYGKQAVLDRSANTVTLRVRAGADIYLYFYTKGSCSVTISATIDDGSTDTEKVSGVNAQNVVFETTGGRTK